MPEKKSSDRTRTWCAVVYPDSAPSNWRDLLDEQHIPWACSPLHEFDVNPDGECKKPHWHIVISFEGVKSFEQIVEILKPINCPIPQRAHDIRGAVRYLIHLDNPEKFQYDRSGIESHGGFDVSAALQPSASERYAIIDEMVQFCHDNHVTEFTVLMDYARAERRGDWFPLLCDSCTFVLQQYIKSMRHGSQDPGDGTQGPGERVRP